MGRITTESRLHELETCCERLTALVREHSGRQDEIVNRVLLHFGRLQGQLAVMGHVASTLMQAVDDPIRTRLVASLQVAVENFPHGLPPNFENGFRESAEALIPDIWDLT